MGVIKDIVEAIEKALSIPNKLAGMLQKVQISIANHFGQAIEVSLSRCNNSGPVQIQNHEKQKFEFCKRPLGDTFCVCEFKCEEGMQEFFAYGGDVPERPYYIYEIYATHLVENGSKVRDWGEWTFLRPENVRVDEAAAKSFVQQLINAGANLNEETLVELRMHQFNAQILDTILQKVGVNFKNRNDDTLLHMAADSGYLDAAKMLIGKKSSLIDSINKYHQRPIHLAAENGHYKVLDFLLNNDANVNALANYKKNDGAIVSVSALHLAACYGYKKCVEVLLKHGAKIEQRDSELWTPLHYACFYGCLEVVELLLENGANIHAVDKDGRTPLHAACSEGHLEVIKLLEEKERR